MRFRDPGVMLQGTARLERLCRYLLRPPVTQVCSETSTGYSVSERLLERWTKEVVAPHLSVPLLIGTGIIGGDGRVYSSAISTGAIGDVVVYERIGDTPGRRIGRVFRHGRGAPGAPGDGQLTSCSGRFRIVPVEAGEGDGTTFLAVRGERALVVARALDGSGVVLVAP